MDPRRFADLAPSTMGSLSMGSLSMGSLSKGTLRKPLFFIALIAMLLVVLAETGSQWGLPTESAVDLAGLMADTQKPGPLQLPDDAEVERQDLEDLRSDNPTPPGLGIPSMAWLDGLLLFTVALMGAALLIPERAHGRLQGLLTLIASIIVLIGSLMLLFEALAKLLLMVSLFLAVPFGTLTYMAIYGFFPGGAAAAALSFLMLCKLVFLAALFFAHPRFLQNKGLMLLVVTSLLANFIVSLLHGLVPGFLVNITDTVGAIVVAVLALIWALVFLISSIISILKALRFDRSR